MSNVGLLKEARHPGTPPDCKSSWEKALARLSMGRGCWTDYERRVEGLGADALGWGIGCDEMGVLLFQGANLSHERVVFAGP